MTNEELAYRALLLVCKEIRKNPMADIGEYSPGLINVLAGGTKRDPEGKEYLIYFLNLAAKQIEEEKINNGRME